MVSNPPDLTCYSKDEKSWGESLQNYALMKHYAPEPSVHFRFSRKMAFEWRSPTYNPITNKYTDASMEERVSSFEREISRRELNVARDRQLHRETTRDFLKGWESKAKALDESVVVKDYTDAIPTRRPGFPHATDECQTDLHSLFGKRKKLNMKMRNRTPFHIITLEDPNETDPPSRRESGQSAHDYIKTQTNNMYKRYREKSFDPILQRFMNPSAEVKYIQDMKHKQKCQATWREDRLPPFLKTAESQAYNIFTNEVKNMDLLPEVDKVANGKVTLKRFTDGTSKMKSFVRQRNKEDDRQKRLVEKRYKERSQRMHDSIRHGYDIIKNLPFNGINAVKPPIPLDRLERKSIWTSINSGLKPTLSNGASAQKTIESMHIRPRTTTVNPEGVSKAKFSRTADTIHPIDLAENIRSNIPRQSKSRHSRRMSQVSETLRPRTAGFT